jgi:DNA-binding transcriptional LysR family regulator
MRLQDVDLKLLRVFRAIVDAGGISGAQALLNASQSTLSTQLAELEERLGFRVCERGRRGFALNENGRKLLDAMDDVFAAADRLQNEVATISGELKGVLRVGTMDGMLSNSAWPLASVIGTFSGAAKNTLVDLTLVAPHQMETLLMEGKRDCIIGPVSDKVPGLEYIPLFQERHSLFAHRDHPITREAAASFETLSRHSLIVTAGDLRRFPFIRHGSRGRGGGAESIRPAATVDQMETHMILICSGRFIGFLPDHLGAGRTDLVRVNGTVDLQYLSPVYIAYRRKADTKIILRTFLKKVAEQPLLDCDLTRSGAVQVFAA